jgi:hypothetical protein
VGCGLSDPVIVNALLEAASRQLGLLGGLRRGGSLLVGSSGGVVWAASLFSLFRMIVEGRNQRKITRPGSFF